MFKGLFSSKVRMFLCVFVSVSLTTKKQYTSISVAIDNFTTKSNPLDDLSGIPILVELIGIQSSGPSEATRGLRRKLKYGNGYEQVRALVLLDGLIQNAGTSFQRAVGNDAKLIERLRICATSRMTTPVLRHKCAEMFCAWGNYNDVEGLHELSNLYAVRTRLP